MLENPSEISLYVHKILADAAIRNSNSDTTMQSLQKGKVISLFACINMSISLALWVKDDSGWSSEHSRRNANITATWTKKFAECISF